MADRATNPLLRRIAEVLNRAAEFDEQTRSRLVLLGTCSVAVRLRGAESAVFVFVDDGQISLGIECDEKPDVHIEGGICDFAAMAKARSNGTPLAAGRLEIQGDLAIAQQIQSIIAQASFDGEKMLAQLSGDKIARQIGRVMHGSIGWSRKSTKVLERTIGEYLVVELRLLPTRMEIGKSIEEGANIAAAVDRLRARIARLRRKREAM